MNYGCVGDALVLSMTMPVGCLSVNPSAVIISLSLVTNPRRDNLDALLVDSCWRVDCQARRRVNMLMLNNFSIRRRIKMSRALAFICRKVNSVRAARRKENKKNCLVRTVGTSWFVMEFTGKKLFLHDVATSVRKNLLPKNSGSSLPRNKF